MSINSKVYIGDQYYCAQYDYTMEVIEVLPDQVRVKVIRSKGVVSVGITSMVPRDHASWTDGHWVAVKQSFPIIMSIDLGVSKPIAQTVPIPSHCHRCKSPNEYGAPANRGDKLICGSCRSFE